MLNKYRRSFVCLNMVLVGLVLLGTFILIGAAVYENAYSELKSTMSMVLKPWNSISQEEHHTEEKKPQQPKRSEGESKPSNSLKAETSPSKRQHDDNITTIFYNSRTEKVSVLSETLSFEGEVEDIVSEIARQKKDFGTLKEYHIIYYKEKANNEYKMAVTDVSYIGSHMVKMMIILALAFLLSMGLVFFISLKLSALAAKPMEKAIERERKFVADISHDLKTPITVILANNSILKSNPNAQIAENRQWLDSTDNAAKEMMNLIGEMLTMSSLESVEKNVVREAVNLSSVVERYILQFESVVYERGITIEEEIKDQVTVYATEEYTKRICSSLIENALKYEPDHGKIKIKVDTARKKAIFSVQNFGSVISEEDLPHIFDRFYRGDKTRNLYSGHGLGLPIIRQMTKLIHADIEATSDIQNGTVFTVIFETV